MAMVENLHAFSRALRKAHLKPFAYAVQRFIRLTYGLSLPSSVPVGKGTRFANAGLGTVIHHRAEIGANCVISSCVSVGCRSKQRGIPVIEDDCFIGTGARILGPVRIGRGSVVGANAVVIEDVPPGSIVAGIPARVIRSGIDSRDYADLPDAIGGDIGN